MTGLTDQDKDFLRELLSEMHTASVGANSALIREISSRVDSVEEETRTNTAAIKEILPTVKKMNDAFTTATGIKGIAVYLVAILAALFAWRQL